jgi:retron-type reverse transcriptase
MCTGATNEMSRSVSLDRDESNAIASALEVALGEGSETRFHPHRYWYRHARYCARISWSVESCLTDKRHRSSSAVAIKL